MRHLYRLMLLPSALALSLASIVTGARPVAAQQVTTCRVEYLAPADESMTVAVDGDPFGFSIGPDGCVLRLPATDEQTESEGEALELELEVPGESE